MSGKLCAYVDHHEKTKTWRLTTDCEHIERPKCDAKYFLALPIKSHFCAQNPPPKCA